MKCPVHIIISYMNLHIQIVLHFMLVYGNMLVYTYMKRTYAEKQPNLSYSGAVQFL